MALEAAAPSLEETSDPEYQDMLRRFLASVPASAALMILAMGHMLPAASLKELFLHPASQWLQLALATPVVFWAGLPFLERAWVSVRTRSLNMFTLIALGVMVSYLYSTIAVLAPWLFPDLVQMGHQRTAIYFESASMIVTLVLLGQVLELKARRRTQDAVRMLLSLAPKNARIVHEDGREEDIPVDAVQPNDRLRVRPGEKIPADGIVLSGDGVIDESMITGESMPVDKGPGARVTAGTINQAGSFVMEAHRTGKDTLLSSIVKITLEAARSRAPVQRLADKVSAVFVPVVMGASLITFFLWMVSGHEARFALGIVSAVSVLVIACPCALGLATPMSIMVASGRGARMGILFRDASAIERLRQVDTLVVDKTGTLTEGRPSLEEIVTTADIDERTVLALASGVAEGSEHPLSKALVKEAAGRGIASAVCTDFATYPGRGVRGTAQGKSIILGNSRFMQDEGMDTSRLDAQARRISSRGSTVLFVAID
ncbi:MAG TPA: heavy metal translocating P-type ATPase, partial [Deltaproteobacteria bacterium]|nr:heavy metal translocating P-type ATPase [Deltaproteobacteria bacterium]